MSFNSILIGYIKESLIKQYPCTHTHTHTRLSMYAHTYTLNYKEAVKNVYSMWLSFKKQIIKLTLS